MERKFSSQRLYKLLRFIVILISTLSLIYGIFLLNLIENNKTLNKWESVCSEYKNEAIYGRMAESDCMALGLQEIREEDKAMVICFILAIFLPIIFFGGTAIYKYLNPVKK